MNDDSHFLRSMSAALGSQGNAYHSERCMEIAVGIERLLEARDTLAETLQKFELENEKLRAQLDHAGFLLHQAGNEQEVEKSS